MTSSLAAFDVTSLRDGEMAEAALSVQAFLDAATAFGAMFMDEFERRRTWADDGAHSGAACPRLTSVCWPAA